MDYMTLKEAAEKWGVTPRRSKLLLCCRAYSWCCKDGNYLANSKRCGKAD